MKNWLTFVFALFLGYFSGNGYEWLMQNNSVVIEQVDMPFSKQEIESVYGKRDILSGRGEFEKETFGEWLSLVNISEYPDLFSKFQLVDIERAKTILFEWMSHDFQSAKRYVLNIENDVSEEIRVLFLKTWMRQNYKECIAFLNDARNEESDYWVNLFINFLWKEFPREVYSFLRDADRIKERNVQWYKNLFSDWYRSDPDLALKELQMLEPQYFKRNILKEILQENQFDGVEVFNFIKSEFTGRERDFYMQDVVRKMVREKPDIIFELAYDLRETVSSEERETIFRGMGARISTKTIKDILDNSDWDDNEKKGFIKSMSLFPIEYNWDFGNKFIDYGYVQGDAESELALLDYFSGHEREEFIETMLQNNTWKSVEVALYMFNELSPEKQNKSFYLDILWRMPSNGPQEDLNRYLETAKQFPEWEIFNTENLLGIPSGYDHFFTYFWKELLESDREAAEAWLSSVNDPFIIVKARSYEIEKTISIENLSKKLQELEQYSEYDNAYESYLRIAHNFANTDSDGFRELLLKTEKADWVEDAREIGFHLICEQNAMLAEDFIESLSENPSIQTKCQIEFAYFMEERNAEKALEIALKLPPGQESNDVIMTIFRSFQRANPEAAKEWMKNNNIKIPQDKR